ncbi:MAG: DUF4375 domain-containing protein [Hyphomicrobiales bacterium]|nr:DUF4375 domain-containing protein [Hyphomicrobiales bacterium]MCP4997768.1 DUF4375 domain-containing protein [Hyphomicrobiales bacterium]
MSGHFDWAFEYCSELFEKNSRNPWLLPDPCRTIFLVHGAQVKIGNGGLYYFYEIGYDEVPSCDVFVDAYRRIGADAAADKIAASLKCFPFADPHLKPDECSMCMDEHRDTDDWFDQLSDEVCRDGTVWQKFDDYIAENFEAFSYD